MSASWSWDAAAYVLYLREVHFEEELLDEFAGVDPEVVLPQDLGHVTVEAEVLQQQKIKKIAEKWQVAICSLSFQIRIVLLTGLVSNGFSVVTNAASSCTIVIDNIQKKILLEAKAIFQAVYLDKI